MKKRRRAYKKWDYTKARANEILSQPYEPFAEFFKWYAETFGEAFKDIADNFNNCLHEMAILKGDTNNEERMD